MYNKDLAEKSYSDVGTLDDWRRKWKEAHPDQKDDTPEMVWAYHKAFVKASQKHFEDKKLEVCKWKVSAIIAFVLALLAVIL